MGLAHKNKGGMRLKNEKELVAKANRQKEPKQKKKGKVAQVYDLHQKGIGIKEIAEKMKLSERVVRSYVWRVANPEKYRELLQRYFPAWTASFCSFQSARARQRRASQLSRRLKSPA